MGIISWLRGEHRVEGETYDSTTLLPISGVTVTMRPRTPPPPLVPARSVDSDESGRFSFNDPVKLPVSVDTYHPRYLDQSRSCYSRDLPLRIKLSLRPPDQQSPPEAAQRLETSRSPLDRQPGQQSPPRIAMVDSSPIYASAGGSYTFGGFMGGGYSGFYRRPSPPPPPAEPAKPKIILKEYNENVRIDAALEAAIGPDHPINKCPTCGDPLVQNVYGKWICPKHSKV